MVGFYKCSLLLNGCIHPPDRSPFSSLTCFYPWSPIQVVSEDFLGQITIILSAYWGKILDVAKRVGDLRLGRIFSISATETARKVNQDLHPAEVGVKKFSSIKVAIE